MGAAGELDGGRDEDASEEGLMKGFLVVVVAKEGPLRGEAGAKEDEDFRIGLIARLAC
jgi:hypothetical protein